MCQLIDYMAVACVPGIMGVIIEVKAHSRREARSRAVAKSYLQFPAHARKDIEILDIKEMGTWESL